MLIINSCKIKQLGVVLQYIFWNYYWIMKIPVIQIVYDIGKLLII